MPANPFNLQIRDKIVTQLRTINGAGDYWHHLANFITVNQPPQLEITTTWHINVALAGEQQIGELMGVPNISERKLRLRIELSHRTSDGTDPEADMLKAQQDIERAIYADRTLSGTGGATGCTFAETEVEENELGQIVTGKLNIYYNINYFK